MIKQTENLRTSLKKYRFNRSGVRAKSKKTGIEIFGALDDLWLNKDTDEIVVLDYKATSNKKLVDFTSSDKHYHKSYLRQLDFYAYLLKLNDFKVHDTGYWLICNAQDESQKIFNKRYQSYFYVKIHKIAFHFQPDSAFCTNHM